MITGRRPPVCFRARSLFVVMLGIFISDIADEELYCFYLLASSSDDENRDEELYCFYLLASSSDDENRDELSAAWHRLGVSSDENRELSAA